MNQAQAQAPASAAALFDPFSIEDVLSGVLRVRDQNGALTTWAITLAGPEHPDRKRRLFARQRRMRAQLAKTGKLPTSDPEDDDADQVDDLVACTLGWEGSVLPYSPDTARKLYGDSKRRWLRDQVQAALDERELFMRSSVAA